MLRGILYLYLLAVVAACSYVIAMGYAETDPASREAAFWLEADKTLAEQAEKVGRYLPSDSDRHAESMAYIESKRGEIRSRLEASEQNLAPVRMQRYLAIACIGLHFVLLLLVVRLSREEEWES